MDTKTLSEQLAQAAKQFCDASMMSQGQDFFLIALASGSEGRVYAMAPIHMKQFVQQATYQLSQYEKKNGEIKAQWQPGVISPIQPSGPKNSPGSESDI